jgi:prepilin-type N-terminal cleavage/methylation domain-containing protein
MKILNNQKGYTLVELLIVMFILGTVGTIALSIFVTSLRGGNKSTSVNDIRQNGNYAISQMSKMISYAQVFEGVCKSSDDCTNPANFTTTCTDQGQSYSQIKIMSFDGGETIFSCVGNTISSNSASLTNVSDMLVTSCNFSCTRSSAAVSPTIDVIFTLQSRGNLAENNAKITFETSITPRNIPVSQ